MTRYGMWLLLPALGALASISCGDDSSGGQNDNTTTTTTTTTTTASSGAAGGQEPAPDGGMGGAGGASGQVEWPTVKSQIPQDPEIEQAITDLLGKMSVEQKVGQMVQAEISAITPADVKEYHIGSVLNGGGSWPGGNKNDLAADWVTLADAYYAASTDTSGGAPGAHLGIPIIWGIDAVHGNNNVKGATLFPHNIGLGATHDPDLLERIGAATAAEVAATGLDWTFAPTLAVVRDDRWGRTYEGYSEDPEIVKSYAGRMVSGLQGKAGSADLLNDQHVIATAKHFMGDGGTQFGKDQGDNLSTEEELRDIHAQGYLSAIPAGAQTVMASFSSWQGKKMHGNHYLLTEILKGKLGFDGFVIGDWNGHGQLDGCDNTHCSKAINAGVDMIMVPNDWKAFIANTVAEVGSGEIPVDRVDDAVRRILRVKMRIGLLGPHRTKGAPSTRTLAGKQAVLGSADHRAIAREAVQESLVLLKNKNKILPLSKSAKVLVAGKGADSIPTQSGGWTLSWQGTGNSNTDFPNGQSIYAGIAQAVAAGGGTATLSPDGSLASTSYSAAIVVIGETPYAEGQGDINKSQTLEHAASHPEDLAVLNAIRAKAPTLPIVTVLLSGRPLYVNKELNRSDAFVAAWLPGSEGGGVADVLFGDHDFSGKLSYSWPASDCQTPLNRGDGQTALFPYGFGLKASDADTLADNLPETSTGHGCGVTDPGMAGMTNQPLPVFMGGANKGDFVLRIGGPSNWSGVDVGAAATLPGGEVSVVSTDGQIQESARRVTWTATGQVYSQLAQGSPGIDLTPYGNSQTSVVFRARVESAPTGPVSLAVHCVYPCLGAVDFAGALSAIADGQWHELKVPLKCFVDKGLDLTNVNTPFLLYTESPMAVSLEDIRWEPFTAGATPDCTQFANAKDIINVPVLNLYGDAISAGYAFAAYMNDATQQVDRGGGNMAWVGHMVPGSNIEIHKNGFPADMSAYHTTTGTLKFDILLSSADPMTELLIKVGTDWPHLSDLRLFDEVLGARPALNTWTSVTIPIQTLAASENDLSPGNKVDITSVADMFVIEAIGGNAEVLLDNIRWEE